MSMKWPVMFGVLMCVGLLTACHEQKDDAPETAAAPAVPIPADSPFAKIKMGMSSGEVYAAIGQPTSVDTYTTGKAFIPFHFGGDNMRTDAHYKGIGVVTFSQNNAFSADMSTVEIHYDPNEPGFKKQQ